MRAITVAIGKQGISFFIEHYLKEVLIKKLRDLREDRTVYVGPGAQGEGNLQGQPLDGHWFGTFEDGAAQLSVHLTNGTLENFNPVYNGVTQGAGGAFDVNFTASNFDMKYQWSESYYHQWQQGAYDTQTYGWVNNQSCGAYTVNIAELKVTIKTIFDYDPTTKVWEFKSRGGSVSNIKPGSASQVPMSSYVRLGYSPSCLATHISDQADNAIQSINFVQIMTDQINGILAAIPGSGDMGDGIKYDFSLADSPPPALVFPNEDGVQLAVHGGLITPVFSPPSNYTLPSLPFPTPPTDSDAHHLTMYVSNYEIDALYSACRKAGRLNLTVGPSDLAGDSDLLKTSHYKEVKFFKQYGNRDMEAQIAPADDPLNPLTTFQEVWLFTQKYTKDNTDDPQYLDPNCVMYTLYHQLPTDVWNNVSSFGTEAYASKAELEADLTTSNVGKTYFEIIERAASRSGMVVKSNLKFKLIIKNFADPLPYISFSVLRTDVFTGLGLAINPTNQAQLLTFSVKAASYSATFINATVPGFKWFEGMGNFWQSVGENAYDQVMHDIGAKGSPLPIMKGLQFDFASAQLSVQEGYLSILANVKFIQ